MYHLRGISAVVCGSLCVSILAGCGEQNTYAPPPPPEVTVARPVQQDVMEYTEGTGTTEATESVEIRARVQGWLQKINFKPGTQVNKGDLLFVIDPREYKAALDGAQAELASKKAALDLAQFNHKRMQDLVKKNAAAELEITKAKADWDAAVAAVSAAEAAVAQAKLDHDFTQIRAPISGRISRNLVDVGNLVGAGEATLLTTIVNDDPIYAYINVSERALLKYLQTDAARKERVARKGKELMELGVSGEEGFPHKGNFDWADNRVDPGTGTIRVRGVFPNPDGTLVPGLFARIRAPREILKDALLVTERALGADQRGRYLLVVNSQNVVEYRPVKVGASVDGMRVVEQGIRPGEWVVVNGLQRARPGAKVKPTQAPMPRGRPAATQRPATQSQPTTTKSQPSRSAS
jgi:RND family efflux transporter MFP subunit